MSMETAEWLNQFILVGNVANRPKAWHDDPALRERLGLPSNHFDGPIPVKVVLERLFPWRPMTVPTANLIPCAKKDANFFLPERMMLAGKSFDKGTPVRVVVVPDMQGVVRSDNFLELGHHSDEYRIHDYEQWLIQLQSNVIGDTLTILGAGLLRNGAQAYVQVALPESSHDSESGMEFYPYIMGSTSLDGSIPTTFSGQTLLVVCDNTRNAALRQSESSGRIYKARHTSKSLETSKIRDVRQALRIIHQTNDAMMEELHELSSIKVTPRQWVKVMDIILPLPTKTDADFTLRKFHIAENKREVLNHTYNRDPMARDWRGTALGVVQAVNTYETHYRTVKGNRVTRNLDKAIRGQFNELDRNTVKALATVLDRPELVSAN